MRMSNGSSGTSLDTWTIANATGLHPAYSNCSSSCTQRTHLWQFLCRLEWRQWVCMLVGLCSLASPTLDCMSWAISRAIRSTIPAARASSEDHDKTKRFDLYTVNALASRSVSSSTKLSVISLILEVVGISTCAPQYTNNALFVLIQGFIPFIMNDELIASRAVLI